LTAKNPIHGWDGFGMHPRKMNDTVTEIPLTVRKFGPVTVPFGGGVYFRVLPSFSVYKSIQKLQAGLPLVGYFHPYDIDTSQEKFMHPELNNNRFYNFLMYYNRKNVFKRLQKILDLGLEISTYKDYINREFGKL
jgi:hypothetical protein